MALIQGQWGYIISEHQLGRPCHNSRNTDRYCRHTVCVWVDVTNYEQWMGRPHLKGLRAVKDYCATCFIEGRVNR